jgi:phage baseplate assembly protein W
MASGANSRVGTVSNLGTNGTYDILLFTFPDGFPNSQLLFEFGNTPRKITGLEKVVQTFLKILNTTQGSDPVNPNRGTQFPSLTQNANIISTNSVLSAQLVAAVADATSQTQSILNASSTDAASQMASATVLGINVADDGAILSVNILTVAGQNAAIAIPFPQLDMPLNA